MGKPDPQEKNALSEESDSRKEDIVNELRPDHIVDHQQDGQQLRFISQNGINLHISILTNHIIRVRYLVSSDLQTDFSLNVFAHYSKET